MPLRKNRKFALTFILQTFIPTLLTLPGWSAVFTVVAGCIGFVCSTLNHSGQKGKRLTSLDTCMLTKAVQY